MSTETAPCANEDHARPINAVARMSWPGGRYKPVTACATDLRQSVRVSIDEGHAVLVEPVGGPEAPVIKAIKEVAALHRRAYSEPVRAVLLEAPDAPSYEELPETLEERQKLPARFHIPHWLGDCTPTAWVCAVCWDEGTATQWPCQAASENGGEVFAR